MTFEEYISYFESILANPSQYETYQDEEILGFTKLNWSRMNRWLKKFTADANTTEFIQAIQEKQEWLLITEPWCGDAAHSVLMLYQLVKNNPNINLRIELRDTAPFHIDHYLTNGGKSIPKLIIRDAQQQDLFVWGPRPQGATDLFLEMKASGVDFHDIKEAIQKWYNEDKGKAIQAELIQGLS